MMRGLFLRSIDRKEKIVIFYMDRNHQVTQRYIRVISLQDQSLVAYCYWRKKLRTFKLDNILSAGPVQKKVGA
jgi:predicted DNA-binding transcriptional regulator YafY